MNKFVAGIPFTKVDSKKRIIAGYASVEVVDRDNEIVKKEALEKALAEYMENPIIRWMHKEEPIGKVLNAYVDDKGLFVEAYITDKTPEGKKAWGLIEDGIVKAFSIGGSVNNKFYKTLEDGKRVGVIDDLSLREISVVDIPANPKSFFEVISKIASEGDDMSDVEKIDEELDFCKKAGISTAPWRPPKSQEERRKLKEKCGARAFLLPGELKFPVMDGSCRYNINGVRAAITRAAQHGYKQVEAKARRLYERLKQQLESKGVYIEDLEKIEEGIEEISKSEAVAIRYLSNIVEDLDALYTYVKNNVDNKAIVGKARDVLNAVMAALKELRGGKMAENEIMKQDEQPQVEVQEEQKQEEAPKAEAQEQAQEAPEKEASAEVGELKGSGVNDLLELAKKDKEKKEPAPEAEKKADVDIEKIVELIEKKLEERKGKVVEEKKEEKISGAEALLKLAQMQ